MRPFRKAIPWLMALLLGFLLVPGRTVHAQTNSLVPTEPVLWPLKTELLPGEIIHGTQIFRQRLLCSTNQFLLTIPDETRAVLSNEQELQLIRRDERVFALLRFWKLPQAATFQELATQKSFLLSRYSNIRDLQVSASAFADHPGNCFTFFESSPSGAARFHRVLLVPCKIGLIELSVNADAEVKENASLFFSLLRKGLQSDEAGPIVIHPKPESN